MITIDSMRHGFDQLTPDDLRTNITNARGSQYYTHDSKVVSGSVQAVVLNDIIKPLAEKYGYKLEEAPEKVYPDATLTSEDSTVDMHRLAIDIKTTPMERGKKRPFLKSNALCLGSYKSFVTNGTSSILYPAYTYNDHLVFVLVYEREGNSYKPLATALRHKHEIIGLKEGSNNTKNMGSVQVHTPEEFQNIDGPFTWFRDAKGAYLQYWKHYERYACVRRAQISLYDHPEFDQFG